jgi:cob(I)alamin adenosyltransferase
LIPLGVIEKGLIQVYTGNGKGKTTCALGLTVRAAGNGIPVAIVQFLKGWDFYGEIQGLGFLPGVTLERTGRAEFVRKTGPIPEDYDEARRGLETARRFIMDETHELVILDEVNVALNYGLISVRDVLEVVQGRPEGVEVVLTGRNAPEKILEVADLVTEMREVKHPFRAGIKARKGIEY